MAAFPRIYDQQEKTRQHFEASRQRNEALGRLGGLTRSQNEAIDQAFEQCCQLQCTPNQKVSVCALFSLSLISLFIGAISINAEDSINRGIGIGGLTVFGVSTVLGILAIFKNRICSPPESSDADLKAVVIDEKTRLSPTKTVSPACCRGENSCSCKKIVLMALLILGASVAFSWGASGKLDTGASVVLDVVGGFSGLAAIAVIFEACICGR